MRTTMLLLVVLGITTAIAVIVSCGFFWANQAQMVAVMEATRSRAAEQAALADNKLIESYRTRAEKLELQLKSQTEAAAALEAGKPADSAAAPALGAELKNDDDLATVNASDDKTVIDIQCPSGTGAVILTRPGATWPQPLVLRLQLKSLEHMMIMTGRGSLHAAVPVQKDQPTKVWRNNDPKEMFDANSPWHLPITAPTTDRPYFEITLPQQLLESAGDAMQIEWADIHKQQSPASTGAPLE